MRPATEIFEEYRTRASELRALTAEWIAETDGLRRAELVALIEASRAVSDDLMAEYRDACAKRAEELKIARLLP